MGEQEARRLHLHALAQQLGIEVMIAIKHHTYKAVALAPINFIDHMQAIAGVVAFLFNVNLDIKISLGLKVITQVAAAFV